MREQVTYLIIENNISFNIRKGKRKNKTREYCLMNRQSSAEEKQKEKVILNSKTPPFREITVNI